MKVFNQNHQSQILVIDKNQYSRTQIVDLLTLEGYRVREADGNINITNQIVRDSPDLIVLDVIMCDRNGYEICRTIKQDPRTRSIGVILMGFNDDRKSRLKCMEVGGDDLLTKPVDRLLLSARVKFLIEQKRLYEELNRAEMVLFSIAKAIKSRYLNSTKSCDSLTLLARSFGKYLQLSPSEIENLVYTTYLHDIGTVVIPDAILLKRGKLTAKEREIIKQHVLIGEEICQPLANKRDILPIIRHHHERWDGSGYPDGLVGEEIPKLARVFQIIDIYEALTSDRPHKKALTATLALKILREEAEKGWRNSELVEQFITFIENPNSQNEFNKIYSSNNCS